MDRAVQLPHTSAPHPRRRRDLALMLVGAAVLVLCTLAVDPLAVSTTEVSALRAVNDVPEVPFALAWAPMQLGSLAAVPAAALVAVAARRWRLGGGLAAAGILAWLLAKLVKSVVERGRPGALVEGVILRDAPVGGLGFVSGHVAVATALAIAAWPYLALPARWAVVVLAALVGVLRMYVGAHLPLDVVGGASLGLATGAAAHLVLGRPALAPTEGGKA